MNFKKTGQLILKNRHIIRKEENRHVCSKKQEQNAQYYNLLFISVFL